MMILSPSDTLTKTCKVCGRCKPLTDFHRNSTYTDGYTSKCKECVRNYGIAYREAHPELNQKRKAYFESPRGRALMYANIKVYQQRHPDKRAVHIMVGNAIRDGRLIRGSCETCGADKVQAHHDSYNEPFKVRWFCGPCHRAHHKAERAALRSP